MVIIEEYHGLQIQLPKHCDSMWLVGKKDARKYANNYLIQAFDAYNIAYIQGLKFKPGIFEDIFNLLKIKVSIILMPGFGKANLRHLEALLTHSLLFTEIK